MIFNVRIHLPFVESRKIPGTLNNLYPWTKDYSLVYRSIPRQHDLMTLVTETDITYLDRNSNYNTVLYFSSVRNEIFVA
ncbi:hypothetical protein L596_019186 [Steinernema carpocapsae]|uniref:Uncharacterized protein n=1 Tax=Steinernema carpocapsae TaxID=34508 RepID=A0A4U5MPI5_STECR|nr:hypothetical protein L596_019186 [Steinernema carpocapsae]